MVNDLTTSTSEAPTDDDLYSNASAALPSFEYSVDRETLNILGRASVVWLELPYDTDITRLSHYVDFPRIFERIHGISLEHFLISLYAVFVSMNAFDPHKPEGIQRLIVRPSVLLSKSTLPTAVLQNALALISTTTQKLAEKEWASPPASNAKDFTMFKRFPLLEVDKGVYLCYDLSLLRRMFTDGIYWLVCETLSAAETDKFQQLFGDIYAKYIQTLFDFLIPPARPDYHQISKPKFAGTTAEAADLLVASSNTLIFVEAKASLLTPRAKYSGDSRALKADMQAKFIKRISSKTEAKGVGQLAAAINKFVGGAPIPGNNVATADCQVIYPCLLCYDSSVACTYGLLETEFRTMLEGETRKPVVRQLTVITTEDLEYLSSINRIPRLNHVIAQWNRRSEQYVSFGVFIKSKYRLGTAERQTPVSAAYLRFNEALKKYLLE
jgi:hypothetical protein